MRKHFTLALFILSSSFLVAQTQPIEKVEVEQDPVIMDSYDYATGRMLDVPWMFKVTSDNGIRLGLEFKLANAFSVNFNTKWSVINVFNASKIFSNDNLIGVRYYFNHDTRIKQNLQGNNFNGKYTEAGVAIDFSNLFSSFAEPFVSLGLQSRFLKNGLIDTGIKFQYDISNPSVRITSGFDLGLALSSNYKLDEIANNRCAVVRCYDEQFYMFKTQISRLLDISIARNTHEIRLRPNLELEHRISKVGLTMNHELWGQFRNRKYINGQSFAIGELGFRTGIRWYVGKKRRIIKGKTSNNLSGIYIGPIGGIGFVTGKYFDDQIQNGEFWSAGFNAGYQTRLLKNLYIHFTFGAMIREYYNNSNYTLIEKIQNEIEVLVLNDIINEPLTTTVALKPIGRLVVGYAF